ncbi:uncharacterized protein PHALS_05258 [Plasmopara halstedii]|uniref:Uncharacterized protein n=1 Tax=Plasmopara halstedii TaxID=4781 RepID=A0A0P1B2D7_PLAHL|nr:uncharacterized protein PHALS_05258 [Plasmopara halstedii]CEG47935.1 hypothetical protein PHALS_05258 [Plasmopara halstedii]|eukprot:XP_024584304.1 hypothetical protein PHALS_05258 [Plasmopara halstedii]
MALFRRVAGIHSLLKPVAIVMQFSQFVAVSTTYLPVWHQTGFRYNVVSTRTNFSYALRAETTVFLHPILQ